MARISFEVGIEDAVGYMCGVAAILDSMIESERFGYHIYRENALGLLRDTLMFSAKAISVTQLDDAITNRDKSLEVSAE